jgi:putative membrane protein insertion efficiency factor
LKRRPTCRFTPTCSQYAIDAIKNRGAFFGFFLTIWRILRCNPFSSGGYDPPPKPIKKSSGTSSMKRSLVLAATFLTLFSFGFSTWAGQPVKVKDASFLKKAAPVKKVSPKSTKSSGKELTTLKKKGDPAGAIKVSGKVPVVSVKKDATPVAVLTKSATAVKKVQPPKVAIAPEIKKVNPAVDGVKAKPVSKYQSEKPIRFEVPKVNDKRLIYENNLYRVQFTTAGAVFHSFVLKKKEYREYVVPKESLKKNIMKKVDQQMEMVKTWSPAFLPFQLYMAFEDERYIGDKKIEWFMEYKTKRQEWILESRQDSPKSTKWTFVLVSDQPCTPEKLKKKEYCYPVKVKKIYTAHSDRYDLDLAIIVENISGSKIKIKKMEFQVTSLHEGEKSRGFFNPVSLQKEAICYHEDGISVQPFDTILHGPASSGCGGCGGGGCAGGGCSSCSCQRQPSKSKMFSVGSRWAGIDARYFLSAIIKNYTADDGGCHFWGADILGHSGYGILAAYMDSGETKEFAPGKKMSVPFKIYIGPKDMNYLEKVKIFSEPPKVGETKSTNEDSGLSKSVDFGLLKWVGKPMIWFLKVVYSVVGNWGLAIIFLTILIKLATFYFTNKSMRSMKKMASLKPQMDLLQKQYANNKDKLNQEMMALYKKEGVNPLGGCLPMFLQMPIYIAWYQALMASVELYRAPLFGWITDLTTRDPYYVLPLLMGAAMFFQQKMSPTATDNQQAKIMMYMMPIMFTGIMLFLPSGLTLYILTNTLLGLGHQWYLNHTDDKPKA